MQILFEVESGERFYILSHLLEFSNIRFKVRQYFSMGLDIFFYIANGLVASIKCGVLKFENKNLVLKLVVKNYGQVDTNWGGLDST